MEKLDVGFSDGIFFFMLVEGFAEFLLIPIWREHGGAWNTELVWS